MKRILLTVTVFVLTLTLLAGCVAQPAAPSTDGAATPDTTPAQESTEAVAPEEDDSAYYTNEVYSEQIKRYYTAISEQWDEGAYFENELSALAVYYYDGNPLDNVGFTFMDLDADGTMELVIGAILSAEQDPLVFEIWTLLNDAPVMVAQSGSRNRYYLQYAEEDELWSVAYEAENGAANHAFYELQLSSGELKVVQGVVFDAMANEEEPWFMTCDLDWDVSNDTPTDEQTATAVMDASRNNYRAAEYIPYGQYKAG